MSQIELYSYFRSSSAYRIRIALHLKNIEFLYKPVHLLNQGGEQFTSAHISLNPSAQVPVLKIGSQVINQSLPILMYLEELKSNPRIFSKDPYENAKIIECCEIINSGIQPILNLSVLKHLKSTFQMSDHQKNLWIQHWINKGFSALESQLKNSGEYCFGDKITATDLFLIPQVYNAVRFKVNLKKFPKISAINDRCLKLEAFKKAHPDCQPDAAKKQK